MRRTLPLTWGQWKTVKIVRRLTSDHSKFLLILKRYLIEKCWRFNPIYWESVPFLQKLFFLRNWFLNKDCTRLAVVLASKQFPVYFYVGGQWFLSITVLLFWTMKILMHIFSSLLTFLLLFKASCSSKSNGVRQPPHSLPPPQKN